MEINEIEKIEKEYSDLKEKAFLLRRQWNKQTTFSYQMTHSLSSNKANNTTSLWITIPMVLILGIFLAWMVTGGFTTSMQQLSQGGIELQNGHIYSSPNGNWAGYNYQMIEHSDSYSSRYYSPVDGQYIGWMPNSITAVDLNQTG